MLNNSVLMINIPVVGGGNGHGGHHEVEPAVAQTLMSMGIGHLSKPRACYSAWDLLLSDDRSYWAVDGLAVYTGREFYVPYAHYNGQWMPLSRIAGYIAHYVAITGPVPRDEYELLNQFSESSILKVARDQSIFHGLRIKGIS